MSGCCRLAELDQPLAESVAGPVWLPKRLEQHSWQHPLRGDWNIRLQETVLDAPAPVTLVAHSLGCVLVSWWAALFQVARSKVRGALLVARPATPSRRVCAASCRAWSLMLLQKLPLPVDTLVGTAGTTLIAL